MEIINLLILSFIGSVAGLIGGIVLLFKSSWAKKLASFSVPLAAGVLLSLSFLDLLPEAVELAGSNAFTILLLVFILLFVVERFLFYLHHHQEEGEKHLGHSHGENISVNLVIVGDTIHNFLDGVVIGASFLVNPSLATIVAFSTFLHETPHEVADFGILMSRGWSRKKAVYANFLSALATFPGAILTYYFAERVEAGVGILLSIAAGFFLYVATTDFLPEATHAPRKIMGQQVLFLLIGVLMIIGIRLLFPEVGH